MSKKNLIGGGIAALVIGTIMGATVGAYFYAKKEIKEIINGIDNFFDLDNQYEKTEKTEQIDGREIKTEAIFPKDESKRIAHINISDGRMEPISINDMINQQLDKRCNECFYKKNSGFNYIVNDKFYKDYINTVNLFDGDDGK